MCPYYYIECFSNGIFSLFTHLFQYVRILIKTVVLFSELKPLFKSEDVRSEMP